MYSGRQSTSLINAIFTQQQQSQMLNMQTILQFLLIPTIVDATTPYTTFERAASDVGLYENASKTEYINNQQQGKIYYPVKPLT